MTENKTGPDRDISDPTAQKGALFLIVLIVIAVLLAIFIRANRSAEGPLVIETAPEPISVSTWSAQFQDSYISEENFTGLITPRRRSPLGFTTGGQIISLSVDVGEAVTKGQILAALDTRTLRAQLVAAEAQMREAEAAHALAMVTVDRQKALFARDHVSRQRVDEAVAQADTAKARIASARAQTEMLKVQIDLARIRAPFSGTVSQRYVDEGVIAGPAQPVLEVTETERLEAQIGLTAVLSEQLTPGNEYELSTDQGPVRARLRARTGIIDEARRTVNCVFDIMEADRIASGAVVRLSLPQRLESRGLWLPVSALSESDRGLWSVYAARKQSEGWVAQPGLVEIIHQTGEQVYVRGAIRQGDQIILTGLQRITPGQPVTPRPVTEALPAALSEE